MHVFKKFTVKLLCAYKEPIHSIVHVLSCCSDTYVPQYFTFVTN